MRLSRTQTKTLRDGIAAYRKEQDIILRLLRRRGQFTASEFDTWFGRWGNKRPRIRCRAYSPKAFILGVGANGGTEWAFFLDLIQHMIPLGLVEARKIKGEIVYSTPLLKGAAK